MGVIFTPKCLDFSQAQWTFSASFDQKSQYFHSSTLSPNVSFSRDISTKLSIVRSFLFPLKKGAIFPQRYRVKFPFITEPAIPEMPAKKVEGIRLCKALFEFLQPTEIWMRGYFRSNSAWGKQTLTSLSYYYHFLQKVVSSACAAGHFCFELGKWSRATFRVDLSSHSFSLIFFAQCKTIMRKVWGAWMNSLKLD